MFCPSCGKEVPPKARSCESCGKRLRSSVLDVNPAQELVLWLVGLVMVAWIALSDINSFWILVIVTALLLLSFRTRPSPAPRWLKALGILAVLGIVSIVGYGAYLFYGQSSSSSGTSSYQDLPAEEIEKLTGKANITGYGTFSAEIFNYSSWILQNVTVEITVWDGPRPDPQENPFDELATPYLRRRYELVRMEGTGEPNTSSQFSMSVGFTPTAAQTFEWKIVSAQGWKGSSAE